MGFRLYREVLDHAPAELTPAELVVLLVLADAALDETRRTSRGMAELASWTRLKPDTIGKAFRRLAGRGIELRVPTGTDRAGRPVFAYRGHQTDYRIPKFGPWRTEERSASRPTTVEERSASRPGFTDGKVGTSSGLSGSNGLPLVRERSDERQTQGTTEPQKQNRSSARMNDDDRAAVLAEIRRRRPDANDKLAAFIYREDGAAILAELQQSQQKARLADQLAELRKGPQCPDEVPGGASLHPISGEPLCPMCRSRAARAIA